MTQGRAPKYARIIGIGAVCSGALCMLVAGTGRVSSKDARQPCRMAAGFNPIRLPLHGFKWSEGEDLTDDVCGEVPPGAWVRKPAGSSELWIHADGPAGSGRFWDVTVGVSKKQGEHPERGLCFRAWTVGWRTLQKYGGSPLPWLDDLDGDDQAEFILWDSFPLRKDASLAEYGLTAWVYRLDSKSSLVLDWNLSRKMARELAASYREPLVNAPPGLLSLRSEAAAALTLFADDKCSANQENNREPSQ